MKHSIAAIKAKQVIAFMVIGYHAIDAKVIEFIRDAGSKTLRVD